MSTEPAFNSRRIAVNGVTLNVIVEGKGPDVLLVHGFPDCHDVWRYQIPALVKAGYRVIAPDMRGCGLSDAPTATRDYKVSHLVSDLVCLLDALQIRKVRLVAHDWGALICWQLCMRIPTASSATSRCRTATLRPMPMGRSSRSSRAGTCCSSRSVDYRNGSCVPATGGYSEGSPAFRKKHDIGFSICSGPADWQRR